MKARKMDSVALKDSFVSFPVKKIFDCSEFFTAFSRKRLEKKDENRYNIDKAYSRCFLREKKDKDWNYDSTRFFGFEKRRERHRRCK
jgi:hypothetical protein